jgi:hypothetical protein
VGNSLLAIAEFGLEIHRPIEDDLLGFFRLNFAFGKVRDVPGVPIEIQIVHGLPNNALDSSAVAERYLVVETSPVLKARWIRNSASI